jgi:hypothetical protein
MVVTPTRWEIEDEWAIPRTKSNSPRASRISTCTTSDIPWETLFHSGTNVPQVKIQKYLSRVCQCGLCLLSGTWRACINAMNLLHHENGNIWKNETQIIWMTNFFVKTKWCSRIDITSHSKGVFPRRAPDPQCHVVS